MSVGTSVPRAASATHPMASGSRNWTFRLLNPDQQGWSGDWKLAKFYGIIECHQRQELTQEILGTHERQDQEAS